MFTLLIVLVSLSAQAELYWSKDQRGYIEREINRKIVKFIDFQRCYFVDRASIQVTKSDLTINSITVLYSDGDTQTFSLSRTIRRNERSESLEMRYKSYCIRGYSIEATQSYRDRFSADAHFIGELSNRNSGIYYSEQRTLNTINFQEYQQWTRAGLDGSNYDQRPPGVVIPTPPTPIPPQPPVVKPPPVVTQPPPVVKPPPVVTQPPPVIKPPPAVVQPPVVVKPPPVVVVPTPPPQTDAQGICPIGTPLEACPSSQRYCQIHNSDDDSTVTGIQRRIDDEWGPCKRNRTRDSDD